MCLTDGKLRNIEILENIPALISHKMCLTDGKLRCAIKIGSDSITELVPMHSRVRKMESQCDKYKYKYVCSSQNMHLSSRKMESQNDFHHILS